MPSNLAVSTTSSTLCQPVEALDDTALVGLAQSGNSFAFVELCQRHSKSLLWRLYRITRNWDDAEDAMQESHLSAYRNLHRFENRSAFSSWLTSIGINSALMLLRRKRRTFLVLDESYEFPDFAETVFSCHGSGNPEAQYEWQEQHSLLSAAIRRLPRSLRTATELRIDREYSVTEIARALQISESAVKSRLARARSRLRATLAGTGRELDSRRRAPEMLLCTPQSRTEAERASNGFDMAA